MIQSTVAHLQLGNAIARDDIGSTQQYDDDNDDTTADPIMNHKVLWYRYAMCCAQRTLSSSLFSTKWNGKIVEQYCKWFLYSCASEIRWLMRPAQQSYISIAIVSSGNSNNAQRKFNKFRVDSGPRTIPCRYDCMRVKLCCKYSNQTFANAFNHLAPTFDAVPLSLSLDSIHLHRQSLHNAHECTRKTVLAMLLVLLTMTFYVIISTYFIGLSTRRSVNISFEHFLFALQCI